MALARNLTPSELSHTQPNSGSLGEGISPEATSRHNLRRKTGKFFGATRRIQESKRTTMSDGTSCSMGIAQPWHDEAYHAYLNVAEIASVIDNTAKWVAACKMRIGVEQYDGCIKVSDSPKANRHLRRLKGRTGGHRQILHDLVLQAQITGEWFLKGEAVFDGEGPDSQIVDYDNWEGLGVKEVRVAKNDQGKNVFLGTGNGMPLFSGLDGQSENCTSKYDTESGKHYIARGHRRSALNSQLSDSALRKNLGLAKELLKLTDVINAIANSNLSSGLLIIPQEVSFGPDEESIEGGNFADGEDAEDPFIRELVDSMIAPVEDRSSAASLVPNVIVSPAEFVNFFRHIRLGRDIDNEYSRIRKELLDRLARGIDAPPEIMQGKRGVNHWTAFSVDEEFASKHVVPLGQLICEFLTVAYLRPMMIRDETCTPEEASRYHIIFDPSNIVARADQATIARKLFELDAISEEALLRYSGFDVTDSPSVDERRQRLIIDLIKASPVTLAPSLAPLLNGLEHLADIGLDEDKDGPVRNQTKDPKASKGRKLPRVRVNNTRQGDEKDPKNVPDDDLRDADKTPGNDDEDDSRAPTSANSIIDQVTLSANKHYSHIHDALSEYITVILMKQISDAQVKHLSVADEAKRRGEDFGEFTPSASIERMLDCRKSELLGQFGEELIRNNDVDLEELLNGWLDDFASECVDICLVPYREAGQEEDEAVENAFKLSGSIVDGVRNYIMATVTKDIEIEGIPSAVIELNFMEDDEA